MVSLTPLTLKQTNQIDGKIGHQVINVQQRSCHMKKEHSVIYVVYKYKAPVEIQECLLAKQGISEWTISIRRIKVLVDISANHIGLCTKHNNYCMSI